MAGLRFECHGNQASRDSKGRMVSGPLALIVWRKAAQMECVALYKSSSALKDRFLTVQHPRRLLISKELAWFDSREVYRLVRLLKRTAKAFKGFSRNLVMLKVARFAKIQQGE